MGAVDCCGPLPLGLPSVLMVQSCGTFCLAFATQHSIQCCPFSIFGVQGLSSAGLVTLLPIPLILVGHQAFLFGFRARHSSLIVGGGGGLATPSVTTQDGTCPAFPSEGRAADGSPAEHGRCFEGWLPW